MAEYKPKEYDFKNFIEQFPLPQVVKVVEGVYSNEDKSTLSAFDTIHLHMLKNCETVKATDERNHEFYLPLNSPAKVCQVLANPMHREFYNDVRTLAEDFPTYVESKDDVSWLNIETGDVLKLIGITTNPHDDEFLRCECINKQKQDILIPFSHQLRLKTLGNFQDSLLFLKEVVVNAPTFPVLVKFQDNYLKVKRQDINAGCPTGFNELGPLILQETFVMKLVVATCSYEHGSNAVLLTIPCDIDVKVVPVLQDESGNGSAGNKFQIKTLVDIGKFSIDIKETSFKYGGKSIEKQGSGRFQCKHDRTVKPLPQPRNCVTPGVTVTSSQFRNEHKSRDNKTQKKDIKTKLTKSLSYGNVCNNVEPIYEDMSYCLNVKSDESVFRQQYSNNSEDGGDCVPIAAAAAAAAADDDDDDGSVGAQGKDRAVTSNTDQHPTYVNTLHNSSTDERNEYAIPVIPGTFHLQTTDINQNPSQDHDNSIFQGGHLDCHPFDSRKTIRHQTKRVVFDKDTEDVEGVTYMCMSGGDGADSTSVHPEEHSTARRTSRQNLVDSMPSMSSKPSAHQVCDVPPSALQKRRNQLQNRFRKGIHKNMTCLSQNVEKQSKSTSDIASEDYHYVSSIPNANADKQTDISMFLSQTVRKGKDKRKDLSPVDYLNTLTVDEVSDSLQSLNLGRYVETFKANDVDGSLLSDLDDKILDELKVTSHLDRLKIRKLQKEGWTPKY